MRKTAEIVEELAKTADMWAADVKVIGDITAEELRRAMAIVRIALAAARKCRQHALCASSDLGPVIDQLEATIESEGESSSLPVNSATRGDALK